jgi:hypothetical protein
MSTMPGTPPFDDLSEGSRSVPSRVRSFTDGIVTLEVDKEWACWIREEAIRTKRRVGYGNLHEYIIVVALSFVAYCEMIRDYAHDIMMMASHCGRVERQGLYHIKR